MSLKLMYITDKPEIACIAEQAGVDRIFIDMEYIGKALRQYGMDTVQSRHTIVDVKNIKKSISKAEVMVRINPIHEKTEEEINDVIEAGADLLMLPYFKTVEEVKTFIRIVGGRAKTFPLLETPEAVSLLDEILGVDGIDEMHIGLNDLSLGYGKKFMFELLADGTLDEICSKLSEKGIPYGFGGIASLGKGLLPAERIIAEHYRLGSTRAILSRTFCNTNSVENIEEVRETFKREVKRIREFEIECEKKEIDFKENQQEVKRIVREICGLN